MVRSPEVDHLPFGASDSQKNTNALNPLFALSQQLEQRPTGTEKYYLHSSTADSIVVKSERPHRGPAELLSSLKNKAQSNGNTHCAVNGLDGVKDADNTSQSSGRSSRTSVQAYDLNDLMAGPQPLTNGHDDSGNDLECLDLEQEKKARAERIEEMKSREIQVPQSTNGQQEQSQPHSNGYSAPDAIPDRVLPRLSFEQASPIIPSTPICHSPVSDLPADKLASYLALPAKMSQRPPSPTMSTLSIQSGSSEGMTLDHSIRSSSPTSIPNSILRKSVFPSQQGESSQQSLHFSGISESKPVASTSALSLPAAAAPPRTSSRNAMMPKRARSSSNSQSYFNLPLSTEPPLSAGVESEGLEDSIAREAEEMRKERQNRKLLQQQGSKRDRSLSRSVGSSSEEVGEKAAQNVEQARDREVVDLAPAPGEVKERALVGNLIGEDHVNFVLMYNMLTGIRIGVCLYLSFCWFFIAERGCCIQVSRCQAKIKRPLTDEDYSAKHKFSFDM